MNIFELVKKKESKLGFLAAILTGMVAHAYRMLNYIPNAEGITFLEGNGQGIAQGNPFLPLVGWVSSVYNLSWINGMMSIFFMAVAVTLLVDIFELKDKMQIILLAALCVGFPAVTSAFAYMYNADCYMLAYLLMVAAVWSFCKATGWLGRYAAPIGLLWIGLNIFRAGIGVFLVLSLLVLIADILKKVSLKNALLAFGEKLGCMAAAWIGYTIGLWGISKYTGTVLAVHFTFVSPLVAWRKTFDDLSNLMQMVGENGSKLYEGCNIAVACVIVVLMLVLLVRSELWKSPAKLLVLLASTALLPFAAFALNYVEPGVIYETYMQWALVFWYMLVIVLWQKVFGHDWKVLAGKLTAALCAVVLGVLCYANILTANVNYFYMNLAYEKTYANCIDILNRMDDCDSFRNGCYVAVMGRYDSLDFITELKPVVSGVTPKVFLENQSQYVNFWANHCGIILFEVTDEQRNVICNSEIFKAMPAYPSYGCVKEVEGIIIVKLSDEEAK